MIAWLILLSAAIQTVDTSDGTSRAEAGLSVASSTTSPDARGEKMLSTDQRPYHELSSDLKTFMKREALAQSHDDRAAAVFDLCILYEEIKQDPRVADSKTLQRYKALAWSRLTKVKRRLIAELKREEDLAVRAAEKGATATSHTISRMPAEVPLIYANHMTLMGQLVGGPMQVFGQRGAGFRGMSFSDYGPELVELIEKVIAPDFWDTNGGPGRIYYYRPLHALVVTATSELHGKIGGALSTMRAVDGF